MSPLLALTLTTPLILFVAAAACFLIGHLWFLIVAAQRGILWFFAVLVLPFATLILVFVEPRARVPFLLSIVAVGLFVGSVLTMDQVHTKNMSARERLGYLFSDHDSVTKTEAPAGPSLAERKERIRVWQQELERKKAALNPNDAAAQAAFNKELNEYLAELNRVKDDLAKEGH